MALSATATALGVVIHQVAAPAAVTVPINSDNPLRIATAEFVAMGRDVGAAQTWRGRLGSVFGRPGWREDGHHQTSRVVRARWEAAQHNAGGPAAPKDALAAR